MSNKPVPEPWFVKHWTGSGCHRMAVVMALNVKEAINKYKTVVGFRRYYDEEFHEFCVLRETRLINALHSIWKMPYNEHIYNEDGIPRTEAAETTTDA